jgi:hypothetical protein
MACSDGLRSAHGVHGSVVGRVIAGIRVFLAPLEPSACWAHGSTAEMVLGYRLFAGVWVARVHACTVWVTHTHTQVRWVAGFARASYGSFTVGLFTDPC